MNKSNVLDFKTEKLKMSVCSMTKENFCLCLYGFIRLDNDDDYLWRMYRLARTNFSAFWSEIGKLARQDFFNACQ